MGLNVGLPSCTGSVLRMPFAHFKSLPPRTLFPGVIAHCVHAERLTVAEVELASGAVVASHQHVHEQVSCVVSGQLEFTIGAETKRVGPGDCAVIPSNVPHHVRALAPSRVIDVFSPVREDFRR